MTNTKAVLCGSVGKNFVYHACGHKFESRRKWKLLLLLVKCKKGPEALTSPIKIILFIYLFIIISPPIAILFLLTFSLYSTLLQWQVRFNKRFYMSAIWKQRAFYRDACWNRNMAYKGKNPFEKKHGNVFALPAASPTHMECIVSTHFILNPEKYTN